MFGKTLNTKTSARITSALLLTMLLISAMPCTVFAGENKDMNGNKNFILFEVKVRIKDKTAHHKKLTFKLAFYYV